MDGQEEHGDVLSQSTLLKHLTRKWTPAVSKVKRNRVVIIERGIEVNFARDHPKTFLFNNNEMEAMMLKASDEEMQRS
jgi:hypothetical protein